MDWKIGIRSVKPKAAMRWGGIYLPWPLPLLDSCDASATEWRSSRVNLLYEWIKAG